MPALKIEQVCPLCGVLNEDDWPLDIDGEIKDGGCQDCWEAQTSAGWWDMVGSLVKAGIIK